MEHTGPTASLFKHLLQLENPESLTRRPEYRKQPNEPWVSGGLEELRSLQQLASVAPSGPERALLDDLVPRFASAAKTNERWFGEQLRRELAGLVRYYGSAWWVEAIQEDMPGESWFLLNERDKIEAILRAPELLQVEISFPIDLLNLIEQADTLLRTLEEVQIEYADVHLDDRRKRHSQQDWWWWMDKQAIL